MTYNHYAYTLLEKLDLTKLYWWNVCSVIIALLHVDIEGFGEGKGIDAYFHYSLWHPRGMDYL